MDETVAVAQKRSHYLDARASKRTNTQEVEVSKKRQIIDAESDQEHQIREPKKPKRQRRVESDDELEILEGEGAKKLGGEVKGRRFAEDRVEGGGSRERKRVSSRKGRMRERWKIANLDPVNKAALDLLTKRIAAREGTCIAEKKFDCIFVKAAQSPQHIDPNDKRHVIRIEPEWTSDIVDDVKGGLDQLSKLSRKDATTVEYFKYDILIEITGAGKRYARWMISDNYIDARPDEWEKKKFMFNLKATNAPDINKLIESVDKVERNYLDEPPELLKQQLETCSGALARSVLPPAPTDDQSATLPAASSEPPGPLPASQLFHLAELSSQRLRPARTEPQIESVDANPPIHSERPTHQPGDVTGFTADGRPLYALAGGSRYPDMPSPPVGPSVDTTSTQESDLGSLKRKKRSNRQAGKSGGVAAKQKEGGAVGNMAKDGRLIVKLPARTTRNAAKK
ncbi:hypothetical protein FRC09_014815 [Ceratobasidium sp. 395]|nr:hypothetical protein FRC09_014815 [Ceratobasidium sp. 395]